jgi:hypothetical protein
VTEIPVRCKNRSRSTRTVGHDEPESAVTIRRNQRSRWAGIPNYDQAPQLPTGYAGMYLLALVPPLWFKVMNPRVEAYYRGEEWQLSARQFEEAARVHSH